VSRQWVWLLCLGGLSSCGVKALPETARVIVLANGNSPVSLRIARYYLKRRQIPEGQLLVLPLITTGPNAEAMTYFDYQAQIETPLRQFLQSQQLTDQIRYLVLTKGIPLRIFDVPHPLPTNLQYSQVQSVDATLAALDYKGKNLTLRTTNQLLGVVVPNFYWRQKYPFEHSLTGGYLVTRLDGFSETDALALVDRALVPRPRLTGNVLLDPARGDGTSLFPQPRDGYLPCPPENIPNCLLPPQGVSDGDYNDDLRLAQKLIKEQYPQLVVRLAAAKSFAAGTDLIGYISWGSNDEKFSAKTYQQLTFRPGAIVDTAVSTSARTLLPTKVGQSLIAQLLQGKKGVTGARGYTDEPYLLAVGSPSVLLDSYFSGANLATAYYSSTRYLGWRDIVLGDPLATVVYP